MQLSTSLFPFPHHYLQSGHDSLFPVLLRKDEYFLTCIAESLPSVCSTPAADSSALSNFSLGCLALTETSGLQSPCWFWILKD